jgi:cytidine deaminase
MQHIDNELITEARSASEQAYAPYSGFSVGAVLVAKDGRRFAGCNVENLSYGLTICAERNAVFAAVAARCREFDQIVIAADTAEPISPCGACRQVLAEFAPDLPVISANFHGKTAVWHLSELLPRPTTGILHRP